MKVALAQIDIIWEDKEKNKIKCIEFLDKAKNSKVDLIVFPEMTLTGFSMEVEKIGEANSETIEWFQDMSIYYNINIGFGYVEKEKDGFGKNKFIIINSLGKIISNYTKIHPFSYGNENKYYKSGEEIIFARINEFNLSTFICYDLRFPEIFQIASEKAELIVVAANWPEKRKNHWINLIKTRAIENQCYILGVNRYGYGDNLYYSGNSMVVSPCGDVLAEVVDIEEMLIYEINIKEVTELRESFSIKKDRKIDLYEKYMSKMFVHKGAVDFE